MKVGPWDDYVFFTCLLCSKQFDSTDLNLLIAVFNASLYRISTEVITASGKIVVKPIETIQGKG